MYILYFGLVFEPFLIAKFLCCFSCIICTYRSVPTCFLPFINMDGTIEEASKAVAGLSVGNSNTQPEAGALSKK